MSVLLTPQKETWLEMMLVKFIMIPFPNDLQFISFMLLDCIQRPAGLGRLFFGFMQYMILTNCDAALIMPIKNMNRVLADCIVGNFACLERYKHRE